MILVINGLCNADTVKDRIVPRHALNLLGLFFSKKTKILYMKCFPPPPPPSLQKKKKEEKLKKKIIYLKFTNNRSELGIWEV